MGTVTHLHRQIAPLDAALAAGNGNAHRAGRKRWNEEDKEEAARVYYRLTGVTPEESGLVSRFDGPPVHVSLDEPTLLDDLRDLWGDVVEFSHVLAIGICIGALGTVGFAYLWAPF